jgi:3-oxoacyl-[acyl-carrier protein] reductase
MEITLRGSVAIVTGAGRGIGRTVAFTLAAEGADVAVLEIDRVTLRSVEEEFQRKGWSGLFAHCDVRSTADVERAVEATVTRFGRVDILVNNAGVAGGGPVDSLSEECWQHNIDVNLTGTFHLCRAVVPQMKAQRHGRIINASSYAAITPSVGGAAYAASKAGVHYLTRVLAGELGPWNITVNCYAPGMVPTQMNHFTDLPEDRQQRLLDMLALRRWGNEEDIAKLVVFLASDAASYITGSMIDVSGGKLAVQRPEVAYEQYAQALAGQ